LTHSLEYTGFWHPSCFNCRQTQN